MNNEPVAWMGKDYDGLKTDLYFDVEKNKLPYRLYESAIPLYTHPVKELTDDKIADLIKATNDEIGMKNIRTFDFTKVLLRKAQEK